MTTLTQLIEHYCPDSVECVKLGDVAIRQRGIAITAAKMRELDSPNGGIVVFGAGATRALIDSSEIASTNIHTKDSVIVKARGHVGFEMCTVPFTTKSELWSYRSDDPKLNIRYGYYFLSEHSGELAEIARLNGVKLPQLKVSDTDNYLIPLPPREVQDAIVERLDAFAALIESLDSEITLREKRFEYFREQLLTFDESDCVECVKLGGAAEIITGKTPKTSEPALWGGSTPFVTPTDFANGYDSHGRTARSVSDQALQAAKNKIVAPGATLVTCIGASLGGVAFATEQCLTNQQINAVVPSEKLTPRFIYYVMQESADYLRSLGGSGTMPIVNKAKFSEFTLPLPSLEVQQDIADKLDTMQALIDNLKQERELRKSQFEYYREKLLTFNS